MKQKLSLTLGIMVLLIGLATSPAKAANPNLRSVMEAIVALQNSINDLEFFQGNMLPAWYQILPSDQRYFLVMGDKAVLDRETGLVWEKSPLHPCLQNFCTELDTGTRSWLGATDRCRRLAVGGRMGWRLPAIEELTSLVDLNNPGGNPYLSLGHPFDNVQPNWYWSTTTIDPVYATGYAYVVDFSIGSVDTAAKSSDRFVWCVRGGQGVDPQ